jgi:hypothetical protein
MGKPEGVQIHRGDGTVLNCELIHRGVFDDGEDHWEVAGIEFHPEHGDFITVQEVPPKISISFRGPKWEPDEPIEEL